MNNPLSNREENYILSAAESSEEDVEGRNTAMQYIKESDSVMKTKRTFGNNEYIVATDFNWFVRVLKKFAYSS